MNCEKTKKVKLIVELVLLVILTVRVAMDGVVLYRLAVAAFDRLTPMTEYVALKQTPKLQFEVKDTPVIRGPVGVGDGVGVIVGVGVLVGVGVYVGVGVLVGVGDGVVKASTCKCRTSAFEASFKMTSNTTLSIPVL